MSHGSFGSMSAFSLDISVAQSYSMSSVPTKAPTSSLVFSFPFSYSSSLSIASHFSYSYEASSIYSQRFSTSYIELNTTRTFSSGFSLNFESSYLYSSDHSIFLDYSISHAYSLSVADLEVFPTWAPTAEFYRLVSVSFTMAFESTPLSSAQSRALESATALTIGVPHLDDFTLAELSARRRLYAGRHVLGDDALHPAVARAWHAAHRRLLATDVEVSFGVASNASSADRLAANIVAALTGSANATAAFNALVSELLNMTVVLDASSLVVIVATRNPSLSPTSISTTSPWPTPIPSSAPSTLPSTLPSAASLRACLQIVCLPCLWF
jgi:hypothetical protein